ncbi:hypothetical protein [Microbacterium plantarum]|uniref:Uncharacterized protein n=1 Tax=Microbacterium plantarum TaxID=1816425 RepID=A0ABV5ENF2_9MICO
MMSISGDGGNIQGLVFWIVFFIALSVEALLVVIRGSRAVTRQRPERDNSDDSGTLIDEIRVERRLKLAALRQANLERRDSDGPGNS